MPGDMHSWKVEPRTKPLEIVDKIVQREGHRRHRRGAVATKVIADAPKPRLKIVHHAVPGIVGGANSMHQDKRVSVSGFPGRTIDFLRHC